MVATQSSMAEVASQSLVSSGEEAEVLGLGLGFGLKHCLPPNNNRAACQVPCISALVLPPVPW